MNEDLLRTISNELKKKNLTIATAESCTGGLVAHQLTNISGSSEYFERGVVSYSNKSKIEMLDVPKETLEQYGAVSKEIAQAMAQGIKNKSQVDIGISTTGVAGPTGGTKEKPVGLVYIGIAKENYVDVKRFLFTGNRIQNKEKTCHEVLHFILETIT